MKSHVHVTTCDRKTQVDVMERGNIGSYNEIVATAWLLKNGYDVFKNVSCHGLVDLIAIKGTETILIDVKAGQIHSGKRHGFTLKPEQVSMGVKNLMVYPDGVCILDAPSLKKRIPAKLFEHICARCSNPFITKLKNSKFCCNPCKSKYHAANGPYNSHKRSQARYSSVS